MNIVSDLQPRKRALVIGAKAPVPGTVKTRLGRTIGHDRAAMLYQAFLRDLGARFRTMLGCDVFWAVSPEAANWAAIVGVPVQTFAQVGPDWTARQRHIFAWTAARGYTETVLIASDSPQLTHATVRAAFRALEDDAAVLLPTYDGGYSLIGQRRGIDILGATPMSTRTVFDDLCATAMLQGSIVAALPPTWDVDDEGDLGHLAGYLAGDHDAPATARVFSQLGFGRVLPQPVAAFRLAGGGA